MSTRTKVQNYFYFYGTDFVRQQPSDYQTYYNESMHDLHESTIL